MKTLLVSITAIAVAQLHIAPGDHSILDLAEGSWELDPTRVDDVGDFRCDKTPLTISIDKDAMRYISVIGEYTETADILSVEGDRFWIRYDGETRTDDNGEIVEWAWVSLGEDSFRWVRRDWLVTNPGGGTSLRRRCPSPDLIS